MVLVLMGVVLVGVVFVSVVVVVVVNVVVVVVNVVRRCLSLILLSQSTCLNLISIFIKNSSVVGIFTKFSTQCYNFQHLASTKQRATARYTLEHHSIPIPFTSNRR